jgi:hypothetical protein
MMTVQPPADFHPALVRQWRIGTGGIGVEIEGEGINANDDSGEGRDISDDTTSNVWPSFLHNETTRSEYQVGESGETTTLSISTVISAVT